MNTVEICAFHDVATSTLTYVVWDVSTRDAVVIDPLVDYDPAQARPSSESVRKVIRFVEAHDLLVHWVMDTHVHADHLTGSLELKKVWPGAQWAMSYSLNEVFAKFQAVYKWPKSLELAKLGVDRWLRDQEELTAGSLVVQAIATPGHTPACMTYRIGQNLFTGDCLMLPDAGVGRCDFPGGSAPQLYDSIWSKLYSLSESYQVFVGHDYSPGGRPMRYQSSIGAQMRSNIHLTNSTSRQDFIRFREARDKTLVPPRLLDQSLDWNLGAHQLVKPLN